MTGPVVHPLLQEAVVGEIERAGSEHRGSRWVCGAFTDLDDLASHSCGVFHGEPFSVFAKPVVLPGPDEAGVIPDL